MLEPKKLTRLLVGAAIGVVLLVTGWNFAPGHKEFVLLILMPLLYEAWALVNQGNLDTISEAHWWLAQRPLVPFLYGVITTLLILYSGWHPFLLFAWVGLQSHFWFQSDVVYKSLWETK